MYCYWRIKNVDIKKEASHNYGRTLLLNLFPILEGNPNILQAVNRHKIHQRMPSLRLELRQHGVSLGKVSQELLNGGSTDSLVVHFGTDGIMLGFGVVKTFDEGFVATLEIRLVKGDTGIFVDASAYKSAVLVEGLISTLRRTLPRSIGSS